MSLYLAQRVLLKQLTRRSLVSLNKTKDYYLTTDEKNDKNKSNQSIEKKDEKIKSELKSLSEKQEFDVEVPRKPLTRVPAMEEEKDVWLQIKTSLKNFASLKIPKTLPQHCDVLVVGGGIVGTFVGYWMKKTNPNINVVIIERDTDYTQSSTFWSVGGFRQQFSLVENIKMSLFGAEFLRSAKENLNIENEIEPTEVDLDINHDGYLFLATKKTAQKMIENHKIQLNQGAKVKLYSPDELKRNFDWINTDGIELASFGYMNEGWVDPRKYLLALRMKVESLGVHFIKGQLVGFEASELGISPHSPFRTIKRALVDTFDGKLVPVSFQNVVNAAGPWASDVAKLAGIGVEYEEDDLPQQSFKTELPVEKRKRYIYLVKADEGPVLNVPLTIDHTGVFFRRHNISNYYLCGLNQDEASEPKNLNLAEIDYDYYNDRIKPVLMKRVRGFDKLKLVQAWAGYYEYNTFDQNLIIGRHHLHGNMIFANGSSGHGLQHSAAIGRAVTELICYGKYKTIDLTRFGFDRIVNNLPMKEIDVV